MPYTLGPGKPVIAFNFTAAEQMMATEFDARGITTNAGRDAAVNAGLSQAILNAFVGRLIKCFDLGPPIS
jgi:hypothetical protein